MKTSLMGNSLRPQRRIRVGKGGITPGGDRHVVRLGHRPGGLRHHSIRTGAADGPDLTPAMMELQQRVGGQLARYYRTTDQNGQERQILHGFWVQQVHCHRCRQVIEAHPHFQLAFEAEGDRQWAFCRSCHRVHLLDRDAKEFRCPACKTQTVIAFGPVQHGRLVCPACQAEEDLIEVAGRTGQPPLWRLFALETVSAGPCSVEC